MILFIHPFDKFQTLYKNGKFVIKRALIQFGWKQAITFISKHICALMQIEIYDQKVKAVLYEMRWTTVPHTDLHCIAAFMCGNM